MVGRPSVNGTALWTANQNAIADAMLPQAKRPTSPLWYSLAIHFSWYPCPTFQIALVAINADFVNMNHASWVYCTRHDGFPCATLTCPWSFVSDNSTAWFAWVEYLWHLALSWHHRFWFLYGCWSRWTKTCISLARYLTRFREVSKRQRDQSNSIRGTSQQNNNNKNLIHALTSVQYERMIERFGQGSEIQFHDRVTSTCRGSRHSWRTGVAG